MKTALVLLPSQGLGGGIEQYYEGLRSLWPAELEANEIALLGTGRSGLPARLSFVRQIVTTSIKLRGQSQAVVCLHPNFLVLAKIAASLSACKTQPMCFYYGSEIWGATRRTRLIWRRIKHRAVTISAYSAGALISILGRPAETIRPLPSVLRRDNLQRIPSTDRAEGTALRVLSVFRLNDARGKGGYRLVDAVEAVRAQGIEVELVIAGSGQPPSPLAELTAQHAWFTIERNLDEEHLAALYQSCDVFALATSVAAQPAPCGEGFGIVLAEAALAGLAVIGPAFGGSYDAMADGWNGLVPADESVHALAAAISELCQDRGALTKFKSQSYAWANDRFGEASSDRARLQFRQMLELSR